MAYKVKFLGIDPSFHTGLAAITSSNYEVLMNAQSRETDQVDVPKNIKDRFDKFEHIRAAVMSFVRYHKPELVAIEGYSLAIRSASTSVLIELGAILRYDLHRTGVPWVEVPPTTLKKFVTGKGNAKKPEMCVQAFKRWGVEGSDNEIDAFGLAMFAAAYQQHETGLPQANLKAVEIWSKKCKVN